MNRKLAKLKELIESCNVEDLFAIAHSNLENIHEDWDTDSEERILQEYKLWEELEGKQKLLEKDKVERIKSPQVGWHVDNDLDSYITSDLLLMRYNLGWLAHGELLDSYFREEKEKIAFLQKTGSKLKNLVSRYGGVAHFLGSGANGDAWELKNGSVLKLTFENILANPYMSKLISDLLFKPGPLSKHELMIHEQGSMVCAVDGFERHLYYIVMERTVNIKELYYGDSTHEAAKSIDYILPFIDSEIKSENLWFLSQEDKIKLEELKKMAWTASLKDMYSFLHSPFVLSTIFELAKSAAKSFLQDDILAERVEVISNSIPNISDDWLENLIAQITLKNITLRTDLHAGNLGYREATGYFVYFDY